MSRRNHGDRARGVRAESSSAQAFRRIRSERLLFEELRSLLRDAVDPELEDVRPLALELSPDGGHARVPYVVGAPYLTDESGLRRRTGQALERASGYLRAGLASSLQLRKVPTLGFHFVGLAEEGKDSAEEAQPQGGATVRERGRSDGDDSGSNRSVGQGGEPCPE